MELEWNCAELSICAICPPLTTYKAEVGRRVNIHTYISTISMHLMLTVPHEAL